MPSLYDQRQQNLKYDDVLKVKWVRAWQMRDREDGTLTQRAMNTSSTIPNTTKIREVSGAPPNWPSTRTYVKDKHYEVVRNVSNTTYHSYYPFTEWKVLETVFAQKYTLLDFVVGYTTISIQRNFITVTNYDAELSQITRIIIEPIQEPTTPVFGGGIGGVNGNDLNGNVNPVDGSDLTVDPEDPENPEVDNQNGSGSIAPLVDYAAYPPFIEIQFTKGVASKIIPTTIFPTTVTPLVQSVDEAGNVLGSISTSTHLRKSSTARIYLQDLRYCSIEHTGKPWDKSFLGNTAEDLIAHDSINVAPGSVDMNNPMPPNVGGFDLDFYQSQYQPYKGEIDF